MPDTAPYNQLTPDTILACLEYAGFTPSGRLIALNSYENRVYQAELDTGEFIVVKFYRPERWSSAAILEEHAFAYELADAEIPIIAPHRHNPSSLIDYNAFRFATYPRRGGRTPELDDPQQLEQLGRVLGRIHAIGQSRAFIDRPLMDVAQYGDRALEAIVQSGFVPAHVQHNFYDSANRLLEAIRDRFSSVAATTQRLHGDCHLGNLLWTASGPHFVDLDDCCMGPALQDLWMLLSGPPDDMATQLRSLLRGYELFHEFDDTQLPLLEALRGLRIVHYCGWLTRRWSDPAFPHHFPWFNTARYWEDQLITLREQFERLQHTPTLKL